VADFVSQIDQGADHPPVAPAAILLSQLEYQFLDRLACRRAANWRSLLWSVELPCNQLPVPPEHRFRSNHLRYLFQRPSAESLADLGQTDPLQIR